MVGTFAAAVAIVVAAASVGSAVGDDDATAAATRPASRLGNVVEFPVDMSVPPRRTFMVADSVIAGIDAYRQAGRLTGSTWFTEPGVCRRLATTSCQVSGYSRPPTLVQELDAVPFTPDGYDLFVVATGYNDSADVLAAYWDRIVAAITGAGFEHIAWLDYRTAMGGSVGANSAALNAILRDRATADPAITVWGFDAASSRRPDWFAGDRIHLSPAGAAGIADWLSEMVTTVDVD